MLAFYLGLVERDVLTILSLVSKSKLHSSIIDLSLLPRIRRGELLGVSFLP